MINQPEKKVKAYNTFALNSDFMMQNINGKRKVPQNEWHDKKATNAVHTTAFIT